MATRGISVFFTLPIVIALFAIGSSYLAQQDLPATEVITVQPDQLVVKFLQGVNNGNEEITTSTLDRTVHMEDVGAIRARLIHNYGPPVTCTPVIAERSPSRMVVWTDTITAYGNRYIIDWTVVRHGDRWVIADVGNLRTMLSDMNSL